jgi:hypothetical protein
MRRCTGSRRTAEVVNRGLGFAFDSTLSFPEMIGRLNDVGPWKWHERDSAWYGSRASAHPDPGAGYSLRFDLIESGSNEVGGTVVAGEGRQFCISLRFQSDRPDAESEWTRLEATLRNELLPALGAADVTPTDTID